MWRIMIHGPWLVLMSIDFIVSTPLWSNLIRYLNTVIRFLRVKTLHSFLQGFLSWCFKNLMQRIVMNFWEKVILFYKCSCVEFYNQFIYRFCILLLKIKLSLYYLFMAVEYHRNIPNNIMTRIFFAFQSNISSISV